MKAVKKKRNKRSISVLTMLEMFFSLLLIPCGLAFPQGFEVLDPIESKAVLMMLAFLLLSLTTFLRAASKRYKNQVSQRRLFDFIFSGAFLVCAVLIFLMWDSVMVWTFSGVVFLISLIPGRVLSIVRDRRWYKVLLNGILILALLLFSATVWTGETEDLMNISILIMILIALRSFIRIMTVTFMRLRIDLLMNIIRKTYAAEIIGGLMLLILSISWVLMYTDTSFNQYTDALWYCFAVVTTIGFGDITAVSAIGRILSVILGIYGIIVVALITSIIVNFYGEMKKAGPEEEAADPEAGPETALKNDGTVIINQGEQEQG